MATKKKSKTKSKPRKPKSKKPSLGKVRSKVSIGAKSKKSLKSKKSSKGVISKKKKVAKKKTTKKKVSKAKQVKQKALIAKAKPAKKALTGSEYTLVTLHAETGKVIAPRKGQQVFFAWKSRRGKLYPIESQYSQSYHKADAEGITKAFKAGSPQAYNVYKELTHDVSMVLDKDGNSVREVRFDKQGKEKPIYRWKITGRNVRRAQSTSVHSLEKFLTPLTRGFTPQEPKEIPIGGYVKIPVTFGKSKPIAYHVGRFTGDSIRDTLKHVLPDTSTSELMKKGIRTLIVSCEILAHKPENPYLEDTPDGEDWERWASKIWKDGSVRRFTTAVSVPTLMDFASRTATGFRRAFSSQGLRVTSLVALKEAESAQKNLDKTVFRLLPPVWDSVIQSPQAGVRYKLGTPGRSGKSVPADKYFPLRYEGGTGEAIQDPKHQTVLELNISIQGY